MSTRPIGTAAISTATASRHASRSPRCWWQYPATAMITAILAISDGWNCSGPTSNHACAPLRDAPSASTPIEQRQHGEVHERPEVAELPVVDGDHDHHRDHAEPDRERLALHEVERVHAVPLEARPGGRVDHQQAERADDEGQHEQQDVDVLQRTGLARAPATSGREAAGDGRHQSFPVASACDRRAGGKTADRFDDAPHDRRRRLRAATAFLDDRDHDVLRCVGREVRGEQRRVTLALFARADLRGARLARRPEWCRAGSPGTDAYAVPFGSAVTPAKPASIAARTFGRDVDLPDRLRRERADGVGESGARTDARCAASTACRRWRTRRTRSRAATA